MASQLDDWIREEAAHALAGYDFERLKSLRQSILAWLAEWKEHRNGRRDPGSPLAAVLEMWGDEFPALENSGHVAPALALMLVDPESERDHESRITALRILVIMHLTAAAESGTESAKSEAELLGRKAELRQRLRAYSAEGGRQRQLNARNEWQDKCLMDATAEMSRGTEPSNLVSVLKRKHHYQQHPSTIRRCLQKNGLLPARAKP